MPPFWHPFRIKIDQKIDAKSDCSKGRSKIAPRAPKTLPRRPPDLPGEPQDPLRRLPDPLRTPLDGPKSFSEAPVPRHFFGKFEKINPVFFPKELFVQRSSEKSKNSKTSKKCRKKKSTTVIHSGHPHRSSQKPKALSQRSEPRGWRRWSREALFNPPPPAQHGVL